MDFIQTEILSGSIDTKNGVGSLKNVQFKITRLNESFLSGLKRKRLKSTDSLESDSSTTVSPKVEQFLSETGLNAQLITTKNDKKLIKINKISSFNSHPNDFDDLPSESDITSTYTPSQKFGKNNATHPVLCISFNCTQCNQMFTSQDSLSSHQSNGCPSIIVIEEEAAAAKKPLNSKKKQPRSFICNECGMQYQSNADLSRHMLQIHENSRESPFRCHICSFEFSRASNLRSHLIKVHADEVGKLVHMKKTNDKQLKFEFDMNAINAHKTQVNNAASSSSNNNNNAVIYIKDPLNKNADIQHMVVYVDGKPIFVQNPKPKDSSANRDGPKSDDLKQQCSSSTAFKSSKNLLGCKPVVPYLLAAAAQAAATNHRKQQQLQSSNVISSGNGGESCARSSTYPQSQSTTNPTKVKVIELKQDLEYVQLVSLLKQKNEKLFNPLLHKT
jgi:uncharacterized C2H2 Zn-finger protein